MEAREGNDGSWERRWWRGRKCSEWRGRRGGGGMLCGPGRVVAAATPAIAGARPAGWAVVAAAQTTWCA